LGINEIRIKYAGFHFCGNCLQPISNPHRDRNNEAPASLPEDGAQVAAKPNAPQTWRVDPAITGADIPL
jgi:hypothetical protein